MRNFESMTNKSAGPIRLFVLGDARIETPTAVIEPTAEIVFALALHLILSRKEASSRRALQRLLWPHVDNQVAAHRLRQTILKLRRLGIHVEAVGASRIQVNNDPILIDYESWLKKSPGTGESDRLELLPGYEPQFSSPFAEWLDVQRQTITGAITRSIISTIGVYRRSGQWDALETVASAGRVMSPYNEEITLALAESLAMRGAKLEAVRIVDGYLAEVGPSSRDLRVQAATLRRRIAAGPSTLGAAVTSDLPLVGRASVLHELSSLLSKALSGNSQPVMLLGDAGIGKSRLLTECASFAALQGVTTQRVHCRPSYPHRPLSAFVELVPSLRTLRGAIGCAPDTLAYLDRLTKHEPSGNIAPNDNDSNWIYGRVLRALFDIFDAVSEEAPLLIQIEDAHWLDPTSAQVLGDMFAWCQTRPIVFAMTGRDLPDAWQNGIPENLRTIDVAPLDMGAARELVTNTTRKHGQCIDPLCLEWCVSVGEGNPYFLQELATHWVETGATHGIPASLSALLERRVDRLDSDALQLLQACAILENNSTLARLERVLEYQAHRLLKGINILGTAGMIVSERDEGEGTARARVTSKHELLSNVALSRLSAPAKAFLHRRAGLILEQEIEEHLSTAVLWDCAKHWRNVGDPHRGLALALSCGHQLMKVGLPKAAAEAYAKCLPLCTTDNQRWEVLEAETVAYYRLSDWQRVRETFAMARLLKSRVEPTFCTHDDLELMDLRADWQNLAWDDIASKAMQCLRAEDASPRHRIEAGVMAMMLLGFRGDDDGIREAFHMIELLSVQVEDARSLTFQAGMVYHTAIGDLSKGVEAARQLVVEQRERGHVADLLRAQCNAAVTLRVAGFFDEAQQSLVEALSLAEAHSMELSMIRALPMLGNMALDRDRIEEAKTWHKKLEALSVHPSNRFGYLEVKGLGVRIALAEGNSRLAREELLLSREEAMADGVFHRRAYNCALQAATDLMAGGRTTQDILECMAHAFQHSKGGLHQAYTACVLYAALLKDGQDERAHRIFEDYTRHHRREPWPVPSHLLAPLLQ